MSGKMAGRDISAVEQVNDDKQFRGAKRVVSELGTKNRLRAAQTTRNAPASNRVQVDGAFELRLTRSYENRRLTANGFLSEGYRRAPYLLSWRSIRSHMCSTLI